MPATDFEAIAKAFVLKTLPDSEVELAGDVPFEILKHYEKKALEGLAKGLALPGFRAGHVPAEVARKRLGELSILEEQVELLMRDLYPALVKAHQIDAVGRPQIAITRLALGNPVGIVARTAVYPEVKLPKNWQTIAKNIPLEPVAFENKPADGEIKKDTNTEDAEKEKARQEFLAKEKRRGAIIEQLLAKTEVAIPKVFVDSELEKIIAQLKDDVARFSAQAGTVVSFEDYIKSINKTEPQLRDEFRAQALSRAKLQLALNKIADEEKLEADPEAVENEIKHAKEHFPNARPDLLRIHIQTILRNEKVLQALEASK